MRSAPLPFVPRTIATQIVLLVILSAVIFHLCISAAFFIGRGDFHPPPPPGFGQPPDGKAPDGSHDVHGPHGPNGLHGQFDPHEPHGPPVGPMVFGTLLFIAISFTLFFIWAIYGVTRPLRRFAEAVDAFSVDGSMALLPQSGPREIAVAARALNRMHERVVTMIEQRTRMLAAISHDLRTPITRLRLRAEFVEAAEVRTAMVHDLEQMDAMVHSVLAFVRDGVEAQRTALLDLGALLQTIRDEFVDMGHKVAFAVPSPIFIKGNADELYRAIMNLVSNGVRFGSEVDIVLHQASPDQILIDVIDDGPGIPSERKKTLFAPSRRTEATAASQSSDGFGLGLQISRAIILAHHGTLELLDRLPHGVIARVTLPDTKI